MSQTEIKKCQNCQNDFQIEPDDFDFYEKIKVPPPTWCSTCRIVRRMARRNERTLYKWNCNLCGKEVISMYSEDSPFTVYCVECWWSDKWDPLTFGENVDFSRPFIEQFRGLSFRVPRAALLQKGNVNSPYTNFTDHDKNCYLLFNSGLLEDSMYSRWGVSSKNIVDTFSVFDSELIYESQESKKCYGSSYLNLCDSCFNSSFLFNCQGCQDCYLCSNLRNKKYCFRNKQYNKEEYEKIISEMDLGSYKNVQNLLKEFTSEIVPNTLRKYVIGSKLTNSTGDYIFECKSVKESFHLSESEDSKYCNDCANLKNCMDAYESAFNCELQYECHGCNRTSRSKFTSSSYDDFDLEYAEFSHNSSHLFACIGLRSKQYCILNKQYTKEEYESLVPRIIKHMNSMPYVDKKGRVYRYGEFFPPELSPFAYNETIAQEYFPLTKEQVLEQGYKWKDPDTKEYQPTKQASDLPDHIKDVDDSILNEVIQCAHTNLWTSDVHRLEPTCNHQCTTAFRIIPEELSFYRRMSIPLPRLCPNCRHYERLAQRNPLKLWHRRCMCGGARKNADPDAEQRGSGYVNTTRHFHGDTPCPNEFETSYSPERKEIVYCESCYNAEVV